MTWPRQDWQPLYPGAFANQIQFDRARQRLQTRVLSSDDTAKLDMVFLATADPATPLPPNVERIIAWCLGLATSGEMPIPDVFRGIDAYLKYCDAPRAGGPPGSRMREVVLSRLRLCHCSPPSMS